MSSSRTAAGAVVGPVVRVVSRQEHLLDVLAKLPDPRKRRGVRHPVVALVAVAVCAVLAGARGFVAVGEWARDAGAGVLTRLGMRPGGADESTFRRLFAILDADLLDRLLGLWAASRVTVVGSRLVVAIDGKTLRGARSGRTAAPHLVAALAHGTAAVLGQVTVAEEFNEIPAARDLLGLLNLKGTVVTMDALHTQHDTARTVVDAGGHYVFTVKANQKTTHGKLRKLPWAKVPGHSTTQVGHGRRVRRTIKIVDVPTWIGFTGAAQVAQLRRTVTRKGKKTVEVVYLITSADANTAPPAVLAAWIQGHWQIENRLHWVRDVTYDEDRSQTRTGNTPRVMATLRNTAITLLRLAGWNNIAAALRHHARNPDRPLNPLLTS